MPACMYYNASTSRAVSTFSSCATVFCRFPMQELKYREEEVPVELVNCKVGINESADSIASLLTRMCFKTEVTGNGTSVKVEVPPTRAGKSGMNYDGYLLVM